MCRVVVDVGVLAAVLVLAAPGGLKSMEEKNMKLVVKNCYITHYL